MDANFFCYSIYDRFIQRQPCAFVCACVCAFVNFSLKKTSQKLLTGLLPNFILTFLRCPWARHFRAQPSTGETQESMNNVSCRRDMTEILLKAA